MRATDDPAAAALYAVQRRRRAQLEDLRRVAYGHVDLSSIERRHGPVIAAPCHAVALNRLARLLFVIGLVAFVVAVASLVPGLVGG